MSITDNTKQSRAPLFEIFDADNESLLKVTNLRPKAPVPTVFQITDPDNKQIVVFIGNGESEGPSAIRPYKRGDDTARVFILSKNPDQYNVFNELKGGLGKYSIEMISTIFNIVREFAVVYKVPSIVVRLNKTGLKGREASVIRILNKLIKSRFAGRYEVLDMPDVKGKNVFVAAVRKNAKIEIDKQFQNLEPKQGIAATIAAREEDVVDKTIAKALKVKKPGVLETPSLESDALSIENASVTSINRANVADAVDAFNTNSSMKDFVNSLANTVKRNAEENISQDDYNAVKSLVSQVADKHFSFVTDLYDKETGRKNNDALYRYQSIENQQINDFLNGMLNDQDSYKADVLANLVQGIDVEFAKANDEIPDTLYKSKTYSAEFVNALLSNNGFTEKGYFSTSMKPLPFTGFRDANALDVEVFGTQAGLSISHNDSVKVNFTIVNATNNANPIIVNENPEFASEAEVLYPANSSFKLLSAVVNENQTEMNVVVTPTTSMYSSTQATISSIANDAKAESDKNDTVEFLKNLEMDKPLTAEQTKAVAEFRATNDVTKLVNAGIDPITIDDIIDSNVNDYDYEKANTIFHAIAEESMIAGIPLRNVIDAINKASNIDIYSEISKAASDISGAKVPSCVYLPHYATADELRAIIKHKTVNLPVVTTTQIPPHETREASEYLSPISALPLITDDTKVVFILNLVGNNAVAIQDDEITIRGVKGPFVITYGSFKVSSVAIQDNCVIISCDGTAPVSYDVERRERDVVAIEQFVNRFWVRDVLDSFDEFTDNRLSESDYFIIKNLVLEYYKAYGIDDEKQASKLKRAVNKIAKEFGINTTKNKVGDRFVSQIKWLFDRFMLQTKSDAEYDKYANGSYADPYQEYASGRNDNHHYTRDMIQQKASYILRSLNKNDSDAFFNAVAAYFNDRTDDELHSWARLENVDFDKLMAKIHQEFDITDINIDKDKLNLLPSIDDNKTRVRTPELERIYEFLHNGLDTINMNIVGHKRGSKKYYELFHDMVGLLGYKNIIRLIESYEFNSTVNRHNIDADDIPVLQGFLASFYPNGAQDLAKHDTTKVDRSVYDDIAIDFLPISSNEQYAFASFIDGKRDYLASFVDDKKIIDKDSLFQMVLAFAANDSRVVNDAVYEFYRHPSYQERYTQALKVLNKVGALVNEFHGELPLSNDDGIELYLGPTKNVPLSGVSRTVTTQRAFEQYTLDNINGVLKYVPDLRKVDDEYKSRIANCIMIYAKDKDSSIFYDILDELADTFVDDIEDVMDDLISSVKSHIRGFKGTESQLDMLKLYSSEVDMLARDFDIKDANVKRNIANAIENFRNHRDYDELENSAVEIAKAVHSFGARDTTFATVDETTEHLVNTIEQITDDLNSVRG